MDGTPIRVLLIEDSEDDYLLTRRLLAKVVGQHYVLDWVSTFDQALEIIADHTHDVYLIDYRLGQQTGLDILRLCHDQPLPIILLTSVSNRALDVEAMELGAISFLAKHELTSDLLDRSIRYAIRHKQVEKTLEQNNQVLLQTIEHHTVELEQQKQQLRSLQVQLGEALNKEKVLEDAKSRLLATLSHELRTPLTIISASTELLQLRLSSHLDEWSKRQFQKIANGIYRITHFLDNAAFLTLIDCQSLDTYLQPLELVNYCTQFIQDWKLTEVSHHRVMLVSSEPSLRVLIDNFQLEQLLLNLVGNAVYFSPNHDQVVLELQADGDAIVLKVQDEGIGIPEAEHDKIYQRFYRASNADSVPGMPGTGLGLAVVKQIVELYRGKITIASVVGQGTTVTVWLPIRQVAETVAV